MNFLIPYAITFIIAVLITSLFFIWRRQQEEPLPDLVKSNLKTVSTAFNDRFDALGARVSVTENKIQTLARIQTDEYRSLQAAYLDAMKKYEDWTRQSCQGLQDQINDLNTRMNEQAPKVVKVFRYEVPRPLKPKKKEIRA